MAIRNLISRLTKSTKYNLTVKAEKDLSFEIPASAYDDPVSASREDILFGIKLALLKSLVVEGAAIQDGCLFTLPAAQAAELDDNAISALDLPPRFSGAFTVTFTGNTGTGHFECITKVELPDGTTTSHFDIQANQISFSEKEKYSLDAPSFMAVTALLQHSKLPDSHKSSYKNNKLIAVLQNAKRLGANISLSHFDKIEIVEAQSVSISAELAANGDMLLSPSFGNNINADDIKSRLGQIDLFDGEGVLKVKNKFLLLDEEKIKATAEILSNARVPKELVEDFISAPASFLDASLVNLDVGLSLRVQGAEILRHRYFGVLEQLKSEWFTEHDEIFPVDWVNSEIVDRQDYIDYQNTIQAATETGANSFNFAGKDYEIPSEDYIQELNDRILARITAKEKLADPESASSPNQEQPTPAPSPVIDGNIVLSLIDNEDEHEYGSGFEKFTTPPDSQDFSQENLQRTPFPHQEEGIRWLLAHFDNYPHSNDSGGALLADDMGLGKTYMTLVAVAEKYRRLSLEGKLLKPCIIVAPLSLLENWADEVEKTFSASPFADITILQSDAHLDRYRLPGTTRETKQLQEILKSIDNEDVNSEDNDLSAPLDVSNIKNSLMIGKEFGPRRLDKPGRLILTTYQTLRDYQFSLSQIDLFCAIFDEGQNLKNPNAMATIASKALRAQFKLVASATPVENTLKDLWSLMDVAAPGVLDSWKAFHKKYIKPLSQNLELIEIDSKRAELGQELRLEIGQFMLRRTKAEKLDGLPPKHIYTGDSECIEGEYKQELNACMRGQQLEAYKDIIDTVMRSDPDDRAQATLSALHRLKLVSIHPDFDRNYEIPSNSAHLNKHALLSNKLASTAKIIEEVRTRQEKIIIFATSRIVQSYLAAWLQVQFGIPVPIINGATKAVSKKEGAITRKLIIDEFQQTPGFGVIIMSPIAAGVGLTVTEANNVLHLERLWNPAKERQATDRVYRIGQTRPVYVYYPIATLPGRVSFDQRLGRVIDSKVSLFESVFSPVIINEYELAGAIAA